MAFIQFTTGVLTEQQPAAAVSSSSPVASAEVEGKRFVNLFFIIHFF
jgi:hypothetical protein